MDIALRHSYWSPCFNC